MRAATVLARRSIWSVTLKEIKVKNTLFGVMLFSIMGCFTVDSAFAVDPPFYKGPCAKECRGWCRDGAAELTDVEKLTDLNGDKTHKSPAAWGPLLYVCNCKGAQKSFVVLLQPGACKFITRDKNLPDLLEYLHKNS